MGNTAKGAGNSCKVSERSSILRLSTMITLAEPRNCPICHRVFQPELKEVKRGNGRFCSRSCGLKNRRKPKIPNETCAWCSRRFYLQASHRYNSKSGLFFCCRECKDKAQCIGGLSEIMPPHYGSKEAYRRRAFEYYAHKCDSCSYDEVVEVLEVHHIDEDRSNNHLSNLVILCPTCHRIAHLPTKSEKSVNNKYK